VIRLVGCVFRKDHEVTIVAGRNVARLNSNRNWSAGVEADIGHCEAACG